MSEIKALGIIPARYGSTRLPGKPLLDIGGKTMIRRVYERAIGSQMLKTCIVATDHELIMDECKQHHIPCMLTSPDHINGTERCAEVARMISVPYDILVNIQGDEPMLSPMDIDKLVQLLADQPKADIATLAIECHDMELLARDSVIKIAIARDHQALYFSRSLIPYSRDVTDLGITYYRHIGMYAYRSHTLQQLVTYPPSPLESAEKLEQLRWLENGHKIYLAMTDHISISIDTPNDYQLIKHILS